MFKSIYNAEKIAQDIYRYGLYGLCIIEYTLLGISTLTVTAAKGVVFAATKVGGAFLSLDFLIGCGIGGLIGIAIPLVINGGFMLYKKSSWKK